ncbi:hypothetical protein CMQ_4994 [Grosmannia clavigera kw1407]|uniref:Uncharacterized protein n=1 Tax=Grosmannia clavigera (strain kw1407 / UAMH 11150) TaxID=655863 RepID=F0XK59_GROCL|nr:uncharacterized protein CMQ_4994 [Grosmannia clavigera kw1407]EFX01923.1 hypothetical protein CMQ_4994 [Grosmannia clavigera kw1407]
MLCVGGSRALWRMSVGMVAMRAASTNGGDRSTGRYAGRASTVSSLRPGHGDRAHDLGRLQEERPRRPKKPHYATPQGLASAVLAGVMADPGGQGRPEAVLLVPALPPATAYTAMGRDVVPPRTMAMRPLPSGVKTAMTTADGRKRVESSAGLRVRYGQQHVLHPWSMRYLEATEGGGSSSSSSHQHHHLPHCLAELTRRRYAAKNAGETLWWFVLVHTDGDLPIKSAFVRLAMRRRVQRAFREALRRRGYDQTGRRQTGTETTEKATHSLNGTVRIEGMVRPLLKTAFEPLVTHLERIVGTLERVLGGAKTGSKDFRGFNGGHNGHHGGGYNNTSRNSPIIVRNTRPVRQQTHI